MTTTTADPNTAIKPNETMKDAIKKRNTEVVRHPIITPRRKSALTPGPSDFRINKPMTVAYTGNGVSRPLKCGPNIDAAPVISKTNPVAAIIRAGISHLGDSREKLPEAPEGNIRQINTRKATTPTRDKTPGNETKFSINVIVKKVTQHPIKQANQPSLKDSQLNTIQDMDREINPISVPSADAAAKLVPCSSARKNRTGPEVSGRPRTTPPTEGPHLCATMLMVKMKIGTLTSLIARNSQACNISNTEERCA
jgi:hypothetical protein